MKTKLNKMAQPSLLMEDTPMMEDLPEFSYDLPSTKDGVLVQLSDVISGSRAALNEVLDTMLVKTVGQIKTVLIKNKVDEQMLMSFDPFVYGISRSALVDILNTKVGDIESYALGKNHFHLLGQYIGIQDMQKHSLKESFPNAFKKWSADEEKQLVEYFNQGLSWKEISQRLQRNVNALKLRAEKLNLVSDTGAVPRF